MTIEGRTWLLLMSTLSAVAIGVLASGIPGVATSYGILAAVPMLLPWIVAVASSEPYATSGALRSIAASLLIGIIVYWRYSAGAESAAPDLVASLPSIHGAVAFCFLCAYIVIERHNSNRQIRGDRAQDGRLQQINPLHPQ